MTFPLDEALVTASAPDAYSFCASMMSSAESEVEAVLGGTPRRSRKDFVDMIEEKAYNRDDCGFNEGPEDLIGQRRYDYIVRL